MGNVKDVEGKLPGIEFELKKARLSRNRRKEMVGTAELTCHGVDETRWKKIVSILDGLKLFYSDTIKDDMLDAMGQELEETDGELEEIRKELEKVRQREEALSAANEGFYAENQCLGVRVEYLESLLGSVKDAIGEKEEQDVPSRSNGKTS